MSTHSSEEKGHVNRLPVELEHEIFEIAISQFPRCAHRIIRVARRTREWSVHFFGISLYQVLRLSGLKQSYTASFAPVMMVSSFPPLYLKTAQKKYSKDPDLERIARFGVHVRHVLLQNRTAEEIIDILNLCPNVENLALWIVRGGSDHKLVPTLKALRKLRRLSFDPAWIQHSVNLDERDTPLAFDLPCFAMITHLEIINASTTLSRWSKVSVMPALTHLALDGVVNQQLINRVLRECPRLELLVLFHLEPGYLGEDLSKSQSDHRVVFLQSVSDDFGHWEAGARGQEDYWVTAERIRKETGGAR